MLAISIAIVIGPTPPGTGVIARRLRRDFIERDIADEFVAALDRRVVDAIDPDIDDDRAFAHVFRFHELRLSDRRDDDIRRARDLRQDCACANARPSRSRSRLSPFA